jgi:hypothetical protein
MNGRFENGTKVVFFTESVTRGKVWVEGNYKGLGFRMGANGIEWHENVEVRPGVVHELEVGHCIPAEDFNGEAIHDFIL